VRAAKQLGISTRTIERYRVLLPSDQVLSASYAEKLGELRAAVADWASEASETLRTSCIKLRELVAEAQLADMRNVVGAIKILGELDIVQRHLTDEQQPVAGQSGEEAEATPRREAEGEIPADGAPPIH
jgi:hypothetical protein